MTAVECIPLLTTAEQARRALRDGRGAELRQLLRTLRTSCTMPHGACTDGNELLALSEEVMLAAPLGQRFPRILDPSTMGLAVSLARRAAVSASQAGTYTTADRVDADSRFADAVTGVLNALWQPPQAAASGHRIHGPGLEGVRAIHAASMPSEPVDGLSTLGPHFDAILEEARQAIAPMPDSTREALTSAGTALTALTLRGLCIVEEVLSQLDVLPGGNQAQPPDRVLSSIFSGSLLEDWLCPALVRADAAEPLLGSAGWSTVRALAVRCMALHASADPAAAAAHWPFFASVLTRYGPVAASLPSGSEAAAAAEAIVEACVLFLADVLLLHGADPSGVEGPQRVSDFFQALSQVLGPPAAARAGSGMPPALPGLPARLRRLVAERVCSLLLYGGAWSGREPPSPEDAASEPLHWHPSTSWLAAWLLLEAFYQPPPPAAPNEALMPEEAAEEAAHRGRLLCFFGCLSRASLMHAELLAAAGEVFFSTELWRLGGQQTLGSSRSWRVVQLPRLVRFLSRQLGIAYESRAGVALWLRAVWRPLALLCAEQHADPCLPDALLAAIAAMGMPESPSDGPASGVAGGLWAAAAAEVAQATQEIALSWGGGEEGSGESPRGPFSTAHVKAVPPLRRLAARLFTAAGHGLAAESRDGSKWQEAAVKRRQGLREALAAAGIDAAGIVAATAASLRSWPNCVPRCSRKAAGRQSLARHTSLARRQAPAQRRQPLRHSLPAAAGRPELQASAGSTPARACGGVAATPRKRRRSAVSDDDSDGPPAMKHWQPGPAAGSAMGTCSRAWSLGRPGGS